MMKKLYNLDGLQFISGYGWETQLRISIFGTQSVVWGLN